MKTFTALLIGLASLTASASSDPIIQIDAKTFSGGSYDKHGDIDVPATQCVYAVTVDPYDKNAVVVHLTSLDDRSAYFNFVIPKNRLPLQEGDKFVGTYGYHITYKKGVLKAKLPTSWGDLGTNTKIKISVSSDLMTPTVGHGETNVRGLFRNHKFSELDCTF